MLYMCSDWLLKLRIVCAICEVSESEVRQGEVRRGEVG